MYSKLVVFCWQSFMKRLPAQKIKKKSTKGPFLTTKKGLGPAGNPVLYYDNWIEFYKNNTVNKNYPPPTAKGKKRPVSETESE